jgi:hypothetical protein
MKHAWQLITMFNIFILMVLIYLSFPRSTEGQVWCQACGDYCDQFYSPCTGAAFAGGTDWCSYPAEGGCVEGAVATATCCCYPSPIMIDVAGDGLKLSGANEGVNFAIGTTARLYRIAWTARNSDDAWLVLDRNNNGVIDNGTELFGNFTEQSQPNRGEDRNGFRALAEYDKFQNGGDGNGRIDIHDSIFLSLRLWQDKNHDGISDSSELFSLPSLGISGIDLFYKESKRVDEFGNKFTYRAKIYDSRGTHVGQWAWDVFLKSTTSTADPAWSAISHSIIKQLQ